MKIAILGGSFNPIHLGHLAVADEVCTSLGYEKVLFVPSFVPPHKQMNNQISAYDRAKMVELACEDDERFELEDCEIQRGGTSWTYDTICFLEKKYSPKEKIGLIIGTDLFSTFHLWNHAKELSEKCQLILAERPFQNQNKDFQNKALGKYAEFENQKQDKTFFKDAIILNNKMLPISSTEIRERVMKKSAFRYLVPSKVFKYIIKGNLYGRFSN